MIARVRAWGAHPAGPYLLFALGVLEATVFPAPTEAMLVALILAAPSRAAMWAAVATGGSVAGGILGYAAGAALSGAWMEAVLGWSGSGGWLAEAGELYRDNAALALATSGFTPIPYLVYTAAAGAASVPLPVFVGFSLLGRGLKYSVVAALAATLGSAALRVLERLGPRVAAAVLAVLLLAYLLAAR